MEQNRTNNEKICEIIANEGIHYYKAQKHKFDVKQQEHYIVNQNMNF